MKETILLPSNLHLEVGNKCFKKHHYNNCSKRKFCGYSDTIFFSNSYLFYNNYNKKLCLTLISLATNVFPDPGGPLRMITMRGGRVARPGRARISLIGKGICGTIFSGSILDLGDSCFGIS